MSLKVTFELEDDDLSYFRNSMQQAIARAAQLPAEDVLRAADAHIAEASRAELPSFVRERVQRLAALVEMMRDDEWGLPEAERKNVLAALVYLSEPQDLIPDEVPVLGYVDDAIMIELVVRELRPEIDAFLDFCRYREHERTRNGDSDLSRDEYLAIKRRELHKRMRRRRQSRFSGTSSSGRPRFRLF